MYLSELGKAEYERRDAELVEAFNALLEELKGNSGAHEALERWHALYVNAYECAAQDEGLYCCVETLIDGLKPEPAPETVFLTTD